MSRLKSTSYPSGPVLRIVSGCLLLATLSGCVKPHLGPVAVNMHKLEISASPEQMRQLGSLKMLAAFRLTSEHELFGGLSGLAFGPDPNRLYLISDRGNHLTVRLHHDASGVLTKLSDWRIGAIRDASGRPVEDPFYDAESLVWSGGQAWLIGFEREHRVWRYRTLNGRPRPLNPPAVLSRAPENGGLESMTRLHDGRLLLLCERFIKQEGSVWAWVGGPDIWTAFSFAVGDDFWPTDLTTVPESVPGSAPESGLGSGDLLVLERAFSWTRGMRARIRHVPLSAIGPGVRLQAQELGRLVPPFPVDNFEGLAARRHHPSGRLLLYIVSDDNFNPLQQTLLFQLEWTTPAGMLQR